MYICKVINNEKTEIMKTENQFYITFLNKENGFQKEVIYFNSYESAVQWACDNLGNFNEDMIRINY
jgi:hypothetical protein